MTYKIGDTLPNGGVIIDIESHEHAGHATVLCMFSIGNRTQYVSWRINSVTGDADTGVYRDNLTDAVRKFNERAGRAKPTSILTADTVDFVVERRQHMTVPLPACVQILDGEQVRSLINHYLDNQGEDFQTDEDSWRYFTDDGEEI